jgi:hypothetical protein
MLFGTNGKKTTKKQQRRKKTEGLMMGCVIA